MDLYDFLPPGWMSRIKANSKEGLQRPEQVIEVLIEINSKKMES